MQTPGNKVPEQEGNMKIIRKVEFKPGSYEEELPGISAEFPYIASYVELDKCAGRQSPWLSLIHI